MIKISICDDEIVFCKNLEKLLLKYAQLHNVILNIKIFNSSIHFLDSYTSDTDIVFLDIQMPLQNGLAVAEELRSKDKNVILVFVTSLRQYVFKGYNYQAYQYLLKPITERRITLLLDSLLPKLKQNNDKSIYVKVKGDVHKIRLEDLTYIETQARKALLHVDSGTILVNRKLQDFEKLLSPAMFFRCQSSYIVNLSYIKDVVGYDIYLTTGGQIPVSKQKDGIIAKISTYLGR